MYLASLRTRLRCPVVLLVVCVQESVARWCAAPIELGHPEWTLRPLVLGPGRVPMVDTAEVAVRAPELAVLSALAHGGDKGRHAVLEALVGGLSAIEEGRALLYGDIVLAALPEAAWRYLEELMATGTYEYQSEFARRYYGQGRTEGRTEGMALAVLRVLDKRGLAVSDPARARITAGQDVDQLNRWLERALVATSIDELFDCPETLGAGGA